MDLEALQQNRIPLQGNTSGVYVLFDGDEVVYIGRGWNCLLRVAEHTRKDSDKVFTSWSFIPMEEKANYYALERALIAQYRPRFNKTLGSA